MTTATTAVSTQRERELIGQTVVVIGGSSGIGLATARRAKAEGAQLIITGRRAGTLDEAADEIGVEATAAFDAQDLDQLEAFLVGLPTPVDHVMLSAGGPYYARLDEIDFAQARRAAPSSVSSSRSASPASPTRNPSCACTN